MNIGDLVKLCPHRFALLHSKTMGVIVENDPNSEYIIVKWIDDPTRATHWLETELYALNQQTDKN